MVKVRLLTLPYTSHLHHPLGFPAKLDMEQYDDLPHLKDFDMPMQGLNGHPARYLPVNYTRAR